jgi:hypothetical protein
MSTFALSLPWSHNSHKHTLLSYFTPFLIRIKSLWSRYSTKSSLDSHQRTTTLSMPELQKYLGKVYLWEYVPNLPAAIIFAGLFAILTAAHTWKMFRTKMWFCIPFVIGGFSTFLCTTSTQRLLKS